LNEGHLDHAAEILGRLLEPREHPAAFLQPADQALHDAPPAVRLPVELHRPGRAVLILLRRDHRRDADLQQGRVDPGRPVPFVAGHGQGPGHRLPVAVDDPLIGPLQQRDEGGGLVRLPGGQVEMEGVAMTVAQEVDLRGEAAAGPPQGVIRRLVGVFFFSAPGGAPRGAHHRAVDAPQLAVDLAGVDPCRTEAGEDRIERPVGVPLVEEVPGGGPRSESRRQIAPGRPRPEDPEDGVEDLSPIARRASGAGRRREEVLDRFPFAVRQSMS
jgi:hypothetical protein